MLKLEPTLGKLSEVQSTWGKEEDPMISFKTLIKTNRQSDQVDVILPTLDVAAVEVEVMLYPPPIMSSMRSLLV